MNYSERLDYLIKTRCGNKQRFLDMTGMDRNTLHNWQKSDPDNPTYPDSKRVKVIKECFPDLNFQWLLFGEGEPFLELKPEDEPGGGGGAKLVMNRVVKMQQKRRKLKVAKDPNQKVIPLVRRDEFERLANAVELIASKVALLVGEEGTLSDTPNGVPTQPNQPGQNGHDFGKQGGKHRKMHKEVDEVEILEVGAQRKQAA